MRCSLIKLGIHGATQVSAEVSSLKLNSELAVKRKSSTMDSEVLTPFCETEQPSLGFRKLAAVKIQCELEPLSNGAPSGCYSVMRIET